MHVHGHHRMCVLQDRPGSRPGSQITFSQYPCIERLHHPDDSLVQSLFWELLAHLSYFHSTKVN